MYQIEYVIVKAANSPRPAAWILEKSVDGENFQPWQYYAPSDEECWTRYSVPPVTGKPIFIGDDDVICTSVYSRQTPMENGEVRPISRFPNGLTSTFYRKNNVDLGTLQCAKFLIY